MENPLLNQEKRFSISQEKETEELARAIQESVTELQKEHPEIVGFTLFGSMSKGKENPSDVDGNLFINPELIKEMSIVYKSRAFTTKEPGMLFAVTEHYPVFLKDFERLYWNLFYKKMKEKSPSVSQNFVKDIISLPVSIDIINKMLDEIVPSYAMYPDGIEQKAIIFSSQEKEDKGPFHVPQNSRVEPNNIFYSLFHLDVGGGVRVYRKIILDRLLKEGLIGKKIWETIVKSLESWEQSVKFDETPTKVHYPRTLSEAVSVYGK